MITSEDRAELLDYLDLRYKKIIDCDNDMAKVADEQAKQKIETALINQQLKIIRWVTTTTLGAVIAAVVGLVIASAAK